MERLKVTAYEGNLSDRIQVLHLETDTGKILKRNIKTEAIREAQRRADEQSPRKKPWPQLDAGNGKAFWKNLSEIAMEKFSSLD